MKRLTKVRLINWHYFSNETINVTNNILLTGQNATGKSTILDAITFVVTAGDTQFNVAANENGKRDLKGYVKCKVSRSDKEYLREGDVTGHIALEFYDESRGTYFTVGAVIDAFGDLLPASVLFYQTFEPLSDSFFVSDEGIILGTKDFKKKNTSFEIFLTRKEAKRSFRTTFGNLNEDFFRLIHKALAFKPISDVKEFIYEHLLEEKQIDVDNIKDAIRAYKELEHTLKLIKQKITDLKEIEDIYKDVKSNEDTKNFYSYVLQLFEGKAIELDIEDLKVKKVQINEMKEAKALEIKQIDQEIEALDERSKELYKLLSSNEDFVKNEYIDKQILKTRSIIDELTNLEKDYLTRASFVKDVVRNMRKNDDSEGLKKLANLSINNVHKDLLDNVKLSLIDIDNTLSGEYDKLVSTKNGFEREKLRVLSEINEISRTLRGLENRTLCYNPTVVALKNEIEAGLKNMYGYDVGVYVLAELLEITDEKWADTIEVYLNRRRFNLIIEPRYYDAALQIYNRVKSHKNIHGVGLVNTKKITQYNKPQSRSLASIITSDNIDAKRYINYLVGNVIMCDDVVDLENYSAAITNEGMLYQGYVVSALNYNDVEKSKRTIIKLYREDIVKYAENYVAEATAIFNAIPSQLAHHDKKIKYSSLKEGDRFSSYKDAINWINDSMVGCLCYRLDEPTMFDGFSLQTDKIKCYMVDTGLLLTLAAGDNYLTSDLYKSFVLGKLSVNKGMMTENLIAQIFTTNGKPLRFYEIYDKANADNKKYEVDFLIKQQNKTTPIEVKSGNAKEHASLDYFSKKYKKETTKPIVLTKGDLRETDEYLYLPLAMAMFL